MTIDEVEKIAEGEEDRTWHVRLRNYFPNLHHMVWLRVAWSPDGCTYRLDAKATREISRERAAELLAEG